ncbi:MAG: hypothetical protein HN725_18825 [Alphaproteobacteria bacterium]|jgi:hypothetical protein|nr:hypothetical protein [Alphaproteobacteria bacterium]MBT4085444.1 hypothetical protein [Alphaproteobacteria bacterium]MBT4546144.1 hypothetical protein [Alphaproteobacteria bacterium]MBT7747349.1 hypothetical protein [Alphaproteobacteria bacterium]
MLTYFHGSGLTLESEPGEGTSAIATFSAERLVPVDLAVRGQSETSQQPGVVPGLAAVDPGTV